MKHRDTMHWTDAAVDTIIASDHPPWSTRMTAKHPLFDRADAFSRQHRSGDVIVLPNAWDPGSAVLMAAAGFPAIATTSAGMTFAAGLPDGETLGRAGMLDRIAAIVRRVAVPVTADL